MRRRPGIPIKLGELVEEEWLFITTKSYLIWKAKFGFEDWIFDCKIIIED